MGDGGDVEDAAGGDGVAHCVGAAGGDGVALDEEDRGGADNTGVR